MKIVEYTAVDDNCAAWVNCLLEAAGVPQSTRLQAGEFWGVDWGEEDKRIAEHFKTAKRPVAATPPAKNASAVKKYTVKPGDSLSKIAKRSYGRADQWQKIYEANKKVIGLNPNMIRPGQQLVIP